MQGRITIVAMDINRNDAGYNDYSALTARKKIERIKNRIIQICEELKKKEHDSLWIVALREYTVTESTSKIVNYEVKNLFKNALKELTKQYPRLAVIGGTIASKRHLKNFTHKKSAKERLAKIISEYKLPANWPVEKQSRLEYFKQDQIILHLKKIDKLTKIEDSKKENIAVLNNTCFIVQSGKCKVRRKVIPHDEIIENNEDIPDLVFRPGKGKTVFELIHPITKKPVTVGIEICAEHAYGVLRKFANGNQKPFIQFILSDTVDLFLPNIYAECAVHLDSFVKPQLILTKNEIPANQSIHLYQHNLLRNAFGLRGVLAPVYPVENKIIDLIDNAIEQCAGKAELKDLKKELQSVKNDFKDDMDDNDTLGDVKDHILDLIKIMRKDVLDSNRCFFDFKKQSDLEKKMLGIIRELRNNILNAILSAKNSRYGRGLENLKDISSKSDAPLLAALQPEPMTRLSKWFGCHVSATDNRIYS